MTSLLSRSVMVIFWAPYISVVKPWASNTLQGNPHLAQWGWFLWLDHSLASPCCCRPVLCSGSCLSENHSFHKLVHSACVISLQWGAKCRDILYAAAYTYSLIVSQCFRHFWISPPFQFLWAFAIFIVIPSKICVLTFLHKQNILTLPFRNSP